jgi:type II secretory pathway pseudopilin PulG
MRGRGRSTFAALAALIVVAIAIVAAFRVMGSPAEQRLRRLDERRVEDLNRLSDAIQLYDSRHQRLPASLEEIERDQGTDAARRDPVTQQPYEYRVDGPKAYSLCAHFDRESLREVGFYATWPHGAGRQCFARAAGAAVR